MDIHNRELLTLRHDTIPPDFGQALVEKNLGSFLKKILTVLENLTILLRF